MASAISLIRRLKEALEKEKRQHCLIASISRPRARLQQYLRMSDGALSHYLRRDDDGHSVTKSEKQMPIRRVLDGFDDDTVKETIYRLFELGEVVTVAKVHTKLETQGFKTVHRDTVRRSILRAGFVFGKTSNRTTVMERADIVAARHRFLRKMMTVRSQGRDCYYLDETFILSGHQPTKEWQHTEGAVRKKKNSGLSGKGSRLIVLDIGSKDGFVPGGLFLMKSKSTNDYHEEMDGERFLKWFEDTLPKLDRSKPIVMDNASYHSVLTDDSRRPTTTWLKAKILEWLKEKDATLEGTETKAELLELSKRHHTPKKFKVDEMARAAGFEVIRLPQYHCQFNPIELLWGYEKNYVARNNKDFTLKGVEKLFIEAREKANSENIWEAAVEHCRKLEEKQWTLDRLEVIPMVDDFVITDDNDDDEDDDDGLSVVADSQERVLCVACKTDVEGQWYGCDRCPRWFHAKCLAPEQLACAKKTARGSGVWLCPWCQAFEVRARQGTLRCQQCKGVGPDDETWIVCVREDCCVAIHRLCLTPLVPREEWTCRFCLEE